MVRRNDRSGIGVSPGGGVGAAERGFLLLGSQEGAVSDLDSPNVLLLLSDEHSFRCLSRRSAANGGEPVSTPALDRLADGGTVFENAYCPSPVCGPSRLCLLTGREARAAGAWDNGSVLPPGRTTVADSLSEAGYESILVGKMHLGGSRQFAGFDRRPYGDLTGHAGHQPDPLPTGHGRPVDDPHDDNRMEEPGVTEIPESHLQDAVVARETVAAVRESEGPWFCCASFSRPHDPWTAPERYVERYWDPETRSPTDRLTDPPVGHEGDDADHPLVETHRAVQRENGQEVGTIPHWKLQRARAGYFACVDFLDDVVGDLLARLERSGDLEETIVVYTSDHGELAGEHGLWFKRSYHEASARVPLVIRTPAQRSDGREGHTIGTPVSLLDLYPTLGAMTGASVPGDLDGEDLSRAVRSGVEPDRKPVACDRLDDSFGEDVRFRMVRDGRYKYVAFPEGTPDLFFDVETDPLELDDLLETDDPVVRAERDRLREYAHGTMDFERALAERTAGARLREEFALDFEEPESYSGRNGGVGNCYHMPDGRVVDADTALYNPIEVTDSPPDLFSDFPG
jgi:choline-sulfatase